MITAEGSERKFFRIKTALLLRLAFGFVALVLVVGVAAPFVNAGAYRGRIQKALEDALGRGVSVEGVHFTLFTGPGFVLENVAIDEDPRYGLEPFAYIPTLQLRVRLDKLLLGQIRPLSLRMIDSSLNLVKSDDGSWNAVSLVERLGAPRRAPLNFFPAVEISNGRVDFKLGTRKTTLYITDTELSIYPESSGKIYFKFEGSPARTDRAGNGFGHLVGTANWYLSPSQSGNQLEADVNLQPSNLSELTTLFQGQDLGVHGTVSAHVLISGPFSDLHANGDVQLQDVHRWDLLPSPGDSLRVRFAANVNLREHTFNLATLPARSQENSFSLQLRANEFMTRPTWSVLASMHKAPLASLLPLGRRMGLALPEGLQMEGALDGVVGFSSSTGFEGGVVITDVAANIPNVPPLHSASANVTISGTRIHIEPAILQLASGGTLRAGGDFDLNSQQMTAEITTDDFSVGAFKQTTNAWFGSPQALALLTDGTLSGNFGVRYSAGNVEQKPLWSGEVEFADATLALPGIGVPVTEAQGKASFNEDGFELPKLLGTLGRFPFQASYRYSALAKRPERLRVDFDEADITQIEAALAPTLSDNSLFSHLPFTRRSIPPWLAHRSMEGDLAVGRCSLQKTPLGAVSAHFIWLGTGIQLTSVQVAMSAGMLQGSGSIALTARLPRYHFAMKLNGYQWSGGRLAAQANLDTSGMGLLAVQNVSATGKFSAEGVTLAGSDALNEVSGNFDLAFSGDTPVLKLTNVQAQQNDEDWVGEGATNDDGKLHLDLNNGEKQLHLVSEIHSQRQAQP